MLLLNKTKYFLILSGLIILAGLIVGIARRAEPGAGLTGGHTHHRPRREI